MKLFLFALFCLIHLPPAAFAEETLKESLHGGQVLKTDHSVIELVQEKERTSVYITGHDRKQITDKKLSLSAIARTDDGKEFPLSVSFENDHYSLKPANTYLHKENNYVIMLSVSINGLIDKVRYKLKPVK